MSFKYRFYGRNICFFGLIILFIQCDSNTFPGAVEQNKALGKGLNVLGYDPLWINEDSARFKPHYYQMIKEAGFQHLRVNLHPFRHMDENHKINEIWFSKVDNIIKSATEAELMVVLDMHEFHAMSEKPEENKEAFIAFWNQFSKKYKNAPHSVLFEILNEPHDNLNPQKWNDYMKQALEIIRTTNPERNVIVGPANWYGIKSLKHLDLPENDPHLIVSIHYYKPLEFTHQGAPWSKSHRDTSGVSWTGTSEQMKAVEEDFKIASDWSDQQQRPINLSEFGAYEVAELHDRALYTQFIAQKAEELNWSWAYWQFDKDFIVYDIEKEEWVTPIYKALMFNKEI